jgi:hypothetical protein
MVIAKVPGYIDDQGVWRHDSNDALIENMIDWEPFD